jgi:hypothetical protein
LRRQHSGSRDGALLRRWRLHPASNASTPSTGEASASAWAMRLTVLGATALPAIAADTVGALMPAARARSHPHHPRRASSYRRRAARITTPIRDPSRCSAPSSPRPSLKVTLVSNILG